MSESTIAAIATPPGEGGIGIVRISGPEAFAVADRVFDSVSHKKTAEIPGYTALFGRVKNNHGVLDEGVALVFRAPKSYTGEDTVELMVHGGNLLLRQVLRAALDAGAEPADRGEFSKRAFCNGKMDLTKAESIMGLISAESESSLRLYTASYLGTTAREIEKIEQDLLEADASIATYSDYPEEYLPELSEPVFLRLLTQSEQRLNDLISSYRNGRILRRGIETAIVGKPNVGKSTLMNLLSGSARSIVTDVAGTTRDVIEETVLLGDLTLKLADTAGIHETADTVEAVGVSLAKERLKTADLVLAVFDLSVEPDDDDRALAESLKGKNAVVLLNKSDVKASADYSFLRPLPRVEISAKTGEGLERLEEAVKKAVHLGQIDPDAAMLNNERQYNCALKAQSSLEEAIRALQSGMTLDAVGVCVDDALAALFRLTGKQVTAEVADEIFRRFCVGK